MAANIVKQNDADNLNLTTSWVGGIVPNTNDVAVFDNTLPSGATNLLGATLSWSGIKVLNPGGPVTIQVGNVLTNGPSGIDMSSATTDLSLSNTVNIAPNALQEWNVASGHFLKLGAAPTKFSFNNSQNSGQIQIDTGGGTVTFGAAAAGVIADASGNPYITYGNSDWAALDGSGNVIAASYASTLTAAANWDVQGNTSVGTVDVTSERYNAPTNVTTQITGTATHTARGILVTPASGGGIIQGGNLRPSRSSVAGSPFYFFQNSPNDFTIASTLAVGSSSTPIDFVKGGPGNLILSNAFNSTAGIGLAGGITVNGGKLTAATGQALGAGFVRVNKGKLSVVSGVLLAPATITLQNGTTNTVNVLAANGQTLATNITFSPGSTHLEFSYNNGIPMSTTVAPLLVTNFVANATVTVDIYNGGITTGVFPLVKSPIGLPAGTISALSLGFLPPRVLGYLSNDTANLAIDLVVTNVNQPVTWSTGSGTWDVNNSGNTVWKDALAATTYYQEASGLGDTAVFNDSAAGGTVTINTALSPSGTTVSNNASSYTFSGSAGIGGIGSLNKDGIGSLVLGTANTFAGGLNLKNGTATFTSLANLGSGGINFSGGTLAYNGNSDDISVRAVTFNAGGGTINVGSSTVSYTNAIGNAGAGGFTKAGSGALYLNGTNKYSGPTIIAQGTLALAATNAWISNSVSITISNSATLDVTLGAPVGLILSGAVGQQLLGYGTVNGSVTAGAGTSISPGTSGGTIGTLTVGSLVLNGGTVMLDLSTNTANSDLLVVNGGLGITNGIIQLAATPLTNRTYKLIQFGSLAGGVANLTLSGFTQGGKSATLVANGGEIDLVIADAASDSLSWSGTGSTWNLTGVLDWVSGGNPWAFTNGDTVRFDDNGAAQQTVNITVPVQPSLVIVSNVTAATYTFADGGGKISGNGGITKDGSGSLVINTINDNAGPTVIKSGIVQVNGALGSGNVTNNAQLVFQQAASAVVAGQISGAGAITQQGSATLAISGNNINTGPITIASGTLQVGNGGATGSLGFSAVTNGTSLNINRLGTYALTNNVFGAGQLVVNGGGTVTLGSSLAYQGNTYVSNGIVKLTASEQVPDGNAVAGSTGWLILDGGSSTAGTFDMNGFNETINALSGLASTVNGVITNSGSGTGTNTLTILETAATTWNGSIVDNSAGAKTKVYLFGTNTLRFNLANPYTGGTVVGAGGSLMWANGATVGGATGDLTLSNNATLVLHQSGGAPTVNNNIIVPEAQTARYDSDALGDIISGNFNGGPNSTNLVFATTGLTFGNLTVKQLQNFPGTVRVQAASTLRWFGNVGTLNGGDNTTFELEPGSSMFIRSGGTVYLGSLTGQGTINGGSAAGTGTYVIGSKNQDCVFAGAILNGAPTTNNAIVKTGTAKLTFQGARTNAVFTQDNDFNDISNVVVLPSESYLGNTTVSNGILAFIAPNNIPSNSPAIILATPTAVLDVSKAGYVLNQTDPTSPNLEFFPDGVVTNTIYVTNGTMDLKTNQTLSGVGTVNGILVANQYSTVNVGLPTGILTITTNAQLNGAIFMTLNSTNTPNASELVSPSFTIGATATLVVTNGGTNIANGTVFQLFNHAVSGFASITLPPTNLQSGAYVWATNLNVDGSIQLLSGGITLVNTNAFPIKSVVNGNTMSLSWPPDRLGFRLQTQTNSASTGIGTNWFDVAGSGAATNATVIINAANPMVFYRLIYP